MKVAILGATSKEGRYAKMAQEDLLSHGHEVYPISVREKEVDGLQAYGSLGEIEDKIDTLTLYIGSDRIPGVVKDILSLQPKRVIFNPGTEHLESMASLGHAGIEVVEGCTLVMLRTGSF